MYLIYFGVVLYAVYYYANYLWRFRRLKKMVEQFGGPPAIPIFGNALQFIKSRRGMYNLSQTRTQREANINPSYINTDQITKCLPLIDTIKMCIEWWTTHNYQFRIWLLNKPYIIIGNPEDFEIVAHKTLDRGNMVYKFIADMFGDNILTSKVENWKKHRRIIASALNPNVYFDHFLEIFNKHDKDLVRRLHKEVGTGKHFDLWLYMLQNATVKICETALGYNGKGDDTEAMNYGQAVIKSLELVYKRFFNFWLMPSINFTFYKYLYGYGDIGEKTRNLPMKVLKKRKEELKLLNDNNTNVSHGRELRNAINVLLSTGGITDEDVCDEVNILMAAEKVYREIFEVFEDSDRLPEQSDLNRLPYLEQCIKETLRQFSIVPVTIREAREDIPITNGKIIPAGASVCLCPYSVHKNPNIYPNPDTWDPSNFDPDKVSGRHKCSFVPFSTGPRGCIGEKYAYLSLKAQISTLLRNFRVTTNVKAKDIELTIDILIRSANGYNIKLEYRHGRPLF